MARGARASRAKKKAFTFRATRWTQFIILKNYFIEQCTHRKNEEYKASLILLHHRTFSPKEE